ncbi:MAG: carboxypeptidase regulatory-like domain-containing protein, partial [Blastocatellia bacterium]|nr:carboxypeptidase regulatory-like domain-containing protein [Blastocatellia bacterium]
TDSTGAAIPNAKATLTDVAKGTTKSGVTDGEGNYIFIGLLPSLYELKIEAAGFTASSTRIELTVGQQADIPIKLGTGAVQAEIDVVAGVEVVETQRSEQASTVEAKQIANLPINRRNFLDYALLTPGVASAENISDAQDYRVAQTPQSGLSFGGNNGRGNMVQVDGAETLSSSGGVQATISQEGVQEFQVVRNSYSAEFGGASGGVVNIVSKSGGNNFHGSLFGLFRDQRFDARNAFDYNPSGKSPFNRQQYGGSLGGPIKSDKTFFFGVVERLSQERTAFINLLTDPNLFQINSSSQNATVRQQAALFDFIANSAAPAALKTGAAQLRGALTTTNYANTVKLFTEASGQFPIDEQQTQYSARLDHVFSDRNNGYLRFNVTDARFENQSTGALTAFSRGRTYDALNGGVVGSLNSQFAPTLFNELKLQYSYTRSDFLPNAPIGPEFNIEGFGAFGRQIFLPSINIERHYDVYDNVTYLSGNHTIKFGGSVFMHRLTSDNETFMGGRFNFGAAIPTANLLGATGAAQVANPLNQFILTAPGSPFRDGNGNGLADVFEVPMTSLQSFNLGLPIVYQQGFGNTQLNQTFNRFAIYGQDSWKASQRLTLSYGVRYAIHDEALTIPTSYKDWQPRVGFSWDPWGDGKTVIRGGAGTFVGFLNSAISNVTTQLAATNDPSTIYIVLATPTTNGFGLPRSFDVYQGLLAATNNFSRRVLVSDLANILAPATSVPVGVPRRPIVPGPGSALEVRFRIGPGYRNPTTYQASLGIQRDLGKGFSLETSYQFVRGIHLSRNRDINQFKATGPVNPLNPLGGPTFIRFPSAAQAAAGLTSDMRNPLILQDNIYENTASSFYHAFTAQLQRRFSRNFSINAHYTLAKSIDEVVDFNSDWSAQNPLNLRLDRSLSAFDQRHRLVLSGVLQSSAENAVLRNWVMSPIFVAQSGRPFNLLTGIDSNADGRSQSDRPGLAGRYTGKGEAFYSFDLRVGRRLFAKENRFLELTVEWFNMLNRTNFAGINNVLGAACTTSDGANLVPCTTAGAVNLTNYRLRGKQGLRPTDPLGFTSSFDPRQMQFGARFNF